jgi:dTMP kinase
VWATQGLFPDLVVLLNLDPDKRRDRIEGIPDRIEREDDAFHSKVAEAFIRIAEDHPERFVVIDADAPAEAVHERVKQELLKYLKPEEEGKRE